MNEKSVTCRCPDEFDVDLIFDCGQCFRYIKNDDGSYTGIANGKVIRVRTDEDERFDTGRALTVCGVSEEEFESVWKNYFDLETDYGKIMERLCERDSVIEKAVKYGKGIRLLRQDPWETVLSFIVSQNNNIPRITGCLNSLAENFGEKTEYEGMNALPSFETLSELEESDLSVCRLGYRAKYITETAKAVSKDGGDILYSLASPSVTTEEALSYLQSLSGVGPKVANCIALFSLNKTDCFPVDVWVKRVMNRLYGFDEKDVRGIKSFAAETFGRYGGIAQQYLFYYMRYVKGSDV